MNIHVTYSVFRAGGVSSNTLDEQTVAGVWCALKLFEARALFRFAEIANNWERGQMVSLAITTGSRAGRAWVLNAPYFAQASDLTRSKAGYLNIS